MKRAVSILVRRGDPAAPEVLAVRRPDDDEELPGLWGLPAATLRPGESWWEAAFRAGRQKLGVELAGFRLLCQGWADRPGQPLFMRLFAARLASGAPCVPRPVEGVTQYAEWAWSRPGRLEPAAASGSLCSRLCLAWLRERSEAERDRPGEGGPGADRVAPEVEATAAGPRRVEVTVVRGHGVASGESPEPYVPGGTIRAQMPAFRERGLDLSGFHPGTLNLSLAPLRLAWEHPRATFREVRWSAGLPAETFSFSPCRLLGLEATVSGWLYRPHPETKPRHHHPEDVVEVITRRLEGVEVGFRLGLELDPAEVRAEPLPGRWRATAIGDRLME